MNAALTGGSASTLLSSVTISSAMRPISCSACTSNPTAIPIVRIVAKIHGIPAINGVVRTVIPAASSFPLSPPQSVAPSTRSGSIAIITSTLGAKLEPTVGRSAVSGGLFAETATAIR